MDRGSFLNGMGRVMHQISLYLEEFLWYHHLGLLAALESQAFADQGLTVKLVCPEYHTQGLDKVARGEADFALSEPIHTLPLQVQGKLVVAIAQLFELQGSSVMARADRVKTAADFAGKRLGYPTAPSPNGPAILRQVADSQGVVLDPKSMQRVVIGSNLISALERDAADIVLVTAQHSILLAQQKRLPVTLFSTEAAGIPSFGHNVLVTRQAVMDTKPDLIQRLLKAIAHGTQRVQTDWAYARALAQKHIAFPVESGEAFLQQTLPVLTANLQQPSTLWQRVQHWMHETGLLRQTISTERVFTNEFALQVSSTEHFVSSPSTL
ncbi:MAG: ABC transporter substrate-binding protein [Oculatellaceae cyanobacterium bins.114]|nr:ABC transporter substrate-binding protein [Oculatellaceae cyanobacterium bins.114]